MTDYRNPDGTFKFYCNECGEPYNAISEFRCICSGCAEDLGLPKEDEFTGFFL